MSATDPGGFSLRKASAGPLAGAAVVLVATATLLGLRVPGSALILHLGASLLVACGLWLALELVLVRFPAPRPLPVPVSLPGELPERLARLERSVHLAPASELDLWARFRTPLQPVVRDRLRRERGIDLGAEPEAARRVLGDRLYRLVGEDQIPPPPGGDRIPDKAVADLVGAVESLAGDADR